MTDVMERAVAEALMDGWHLDKWGRPCGASTHDTSWAYRANGCRAPEAEQRHLEVCEQRRMIRRTGKMPSLVESQRAKLIREPDPWCTAEVHAASIRGHRQGCRCRGAVAAHDREMENQRAYQRRVAEQRTLDPRARWRAPAMQVDRTNLFLLRHGAPQIDRATGINVNSKIELMLVIEEWAGTLRHLSGAPYGNKDLGRRLGISASAVCHLKTERARLREQRTARRLAEAQWRALRNARAADAGRGHGPSGHPFHPLWLAAAYRVLARRG